MTKIQGVQVNDVVITSGLGQVFPRGIVIGKVVAIKEDDFAITPKAMIKPMASFQHLREVFVVEVPEAGDHEPVYALACRFFCIVFLLEGTVLDLIIPEAWQTKVLIAPHLVLVVVLYIAYILTRAGR